VSPGPLLALNCRGYFGTSGASSFRFVFVFDIVRVFMLLVGAPTLERRRASSSLFLTAAVLQERRGVQVVWYGVSWQIH
jgi:hypothetical protein